MGAMVQGFSGRRHIAGTNRLGRLAAAALVVLVPGIASAQTTYTGTGSYAWGDVSATGTTTFNVPTSGTLSLTGSNAGFGAQTQIGKIGQGTLVLSQPGPAAWSGSINSGTAPTVLTGGLLVSRGTVVISNAAALGSTSNIAAIDQFKGAAIALSGGVTLPNQVVLTLNTTGAGADGAFSAYGLGMLTSSSGINTLSGSLNVGRSNASVGAAAGATLNITGGVGGNARILTFVGPGSVNISGAGIVNSNGLETFGSGTTTITTSIGLNNAGNSFRVNNGSTLVLAGGAALTGAITTRTMAVNTQGTLRLDNSTTAVSNRLGGGPFLLQLRDSTLNLIGNASTPIVETTGTLALVQGGAKIVVNTTAQATSLQFTNLSTQGTGSLLTLRAAGTGANFGTASNSVVFRTLIPTLTPGTLGLGILPRFVTIDGQGWNFATYSNGSLRAFSAYDTGSLNAASLPTTSPTATVQVGSGVTLAGNRTVNAIKLGGVGLTLGGAGSVLTLTSGGLLVTGGTSTIGAGVAVTSGATPFGLTVADDSKLTVNAPLYTTGANFVRGGGGLVEVAAPIYTPNNFYFLLGGTTRLLAGGMLFPGQGTPTSSVNNLAISAGAVLDLNGNSQVFGQVQSPDNGDFENAGGQVTSATPAIFASRAFDNSFVMPSVTGALSTVFGGRNTQWFTSVSTYTGRTAFLGGTFSFKDGGRLTATSAVDINYGGILKFHNDDSQYALPDRINDAAPVAIRGGRIEFVGQRNSDTGETLGATTLAEGVADFNISKGDATLPGSAVLTLASLAATDGGAYFRGQTATLGLPGDNPRVIVTANETAPNAGLTNNILGGWASVDGTDFASYVPGQGVGALNQTGFAGYDGTTLPASSAPTQNIKLSAAGTVPASTYGLNALSFSGNLDFTNATDTLSLTSGGLMRNSTTGAVTVGATADTGRLTAGDVGATGTQSLYIHNNAASGANNTTINARIVDNGSAPVKLVAMLNNTGTLTLASGNNSYTGGTIVNNRDGAAGTVTIAAGGLLPAGGLTINGAVVTAAAAGGIASSNVVTLNGPGSLTLTGANTLSQLVFNNTGMRNGSQAFPTVTTGGALTLTSATAVIAGGMNAAGVGVITGTLDFAGNTKTFTVTPIQYDGMGFAPFSPALNITGTIVNAGKITVNGGGILQVTGSSTFAGGYSVAGDTGIMISSSSAGAVTSGPLGTGTLEMASGARLLSNGAFNVANVVSMSGTLVFAGVNSGTLSGGFALPATATFDVTAPAAALGLTGVLSGVGSSVVKNGYGTLIVSNANTFDGGVTVNQGGLTIGNATALGTGTLTMAGGRLDASAASLTVTNPQRWNGGFGFVGTNALTMSGAVTLAQNSTLGVTGTLTVSGNITDGGGNYGLTKSGAGFLNLTGANTYGGTTVVNAGVLAINGTAALPGWGTAGRYAVSDGGAIAVPNTVSDADVSTMIATGNFTSGGAIGFDTTAGTRTWSTAITGGMGVAKIGTNALSLSASNSYTGPTIVYSGSLSLANQFAAQNSLLSIQAATNVGFDSAVAANAFTVGGLAGSGTMNLVNSAGTAITLTLGNANATTAFSGRLGGTGGALVKLGSGTQSLSGANIVYTGATTVSAGTLLLDAASAYASATTINSGASFVVANSANQTMSVALTGAGTIVKQAAGTLILSSASNNHSGNLVIEQGQVTYSGGSLASSGTVTILGSGTLNMGASDRWGNSATTTSAKIVIGPGGRMLSGGFYTTLVNPELAGGTLGLSGGVAGTGAYGLKGTVTVSQASALGNTGAGSNNWVNIGPTDADGFLTFDVARMTSGSTNGANPDLNVVTEFRNPTGRVNGLQKTGAGLLLFNATGSYTGNTVIDNGVFQLQGTLTTTGTVIVNNGGVLRMGAHDRWGNANTPATAPIVVNAGGMVQSNNYYNTFIGLTLAGGTLQSTGGFDGTWQAFGLKGSVTVSGNAASSIEVGSGGNGLNAVNIGPTPTDGAAAMMPFNVADVTSSSAADLVVSTQLRNGHSDVNVFNANGILKQGAGTMLLTGSNTFGGGITVSEGVLEVGGSGVLGGGSYSAPIVATGTFRLSSSAAQILSGTISGSGVFEKAGMGALTLTGTSAFAGTTNVQAGRLIVSGSLGSSLTVAAGAMVSGTGSLGAAAISGTLSPGNSPGVLTFTSLGLGSTSSTLIELTGTGTRGIDYDGITVTDSNGLTYGGSLVLQFGATALDDGTAFDIFEFYGSSAGSFTSVTSTGYYAGTWTNTAGTYSLTQGEQVLTFSQATGDLSVVAAVPEPETLVMVVIGLGTLGMTRLRRRAKVMDDEMRRG